MNRVIEDWCLTMSPTTPTTTPTENLKAVRDRQRAALDCCVRTQDQIESDEPWAADVSIVRQQLHRALRHRQHLELHRLHQRQRRLSRRR